MFNVTERWLLKSFLGDAEYSYIFEEELPGVIKHCIGVRRDNKIVTLTAISPTMAIFQYQLCCMCKETGQSINSDLFSLVMHRANEFSAQVGFKAGNENAIEYFKKGCEG